MALFGESYGDTVRVVEIGGPFSVELCGGTHVEHASQIGPVAVLGESSVGSGARRIEAYSGMDSFKFLSKEAALASGLAAELKAPTEELPDRIAQLTERLRAAEKEIENLHRQQLLASTANLADEAQTVGVHRVVAKQLPEGINTGDLRTIANDLRGKLQAEDAVIVLLSQVDGKVSLAAAATPQAVQSGVKAGDLVKLIGQYVEGKGGGKPDLAQGTGANPAGIEDALRAVRESLAE